MSHLKSRLQKIEERVQPKRGVKVFRLGKDDEALQEYIASGGRDLIVRLQPQGDDAWCKKKGDNEGA